MKINRRKLEMELADQCKNMVELKSAGFSTSTLTRIRQGGSITTKTAGRLAKALNVPVTDLLEAEEG